MKRDSTNYRYKTNKSVKSKIDSYLEKANSLYANLGTKSKLDVGTSDMAKAKDFQYMQLIKDVDEIFYYEYLHGKYMDDEIKIFLEEKKANTIEDFIACELMAD